MAVYPAPASSRLAGAAPWPVAAAATAVTAATALALFAPAVASLARLWWESGTYGHGLLVAPISGYLIWRERRAIARRAPRGNLWALPLLALGSVAWALAHLVDVQVGEQLALVLLLATLPWVLLGTAVMKRLAFPLAYLLLAVPVWEVLVPYLQSHTAIQSVHILRALGVPVFLDGIYISIPEGNFRVAEVCAGLRHLLATLAVAALYAYLTFRTTWRRIVFVLVGALLSVLSNWVRVVVIVLIGHLSAMQHPLVDDHIAVGWVLFALALIPLFAFGAWLREAPPGEGEDEFLHAARRPSTSSSLPLMSVAFLAVLAMALGPILAYAAEAREAEFASDIELSPVSPPPGWSGPLEPRNVWRPHFPGTQAQLQRSYEKDGRRVTLFLAYYASEQQGAELVNTLNVPYDARRWAERTGRDGEAEVGGLTLPFRERVLRSGSARQRLVWSWYYANGRFTRDPLATKLHQLAGRFLGRPGAAAVAVAVEMDGVTGQERAVLEDFLRASAPELLESLERISRRVRGA